MSLGLVSDEAIFCLSYSKFLFFKYAQGLRKVSAKSKFTRFFAELQPFLCTKGHEDRYTGSLFRVDEPVPDDYNVWFQCLLLPVAEFMPYAIVILLVPGISSMSNLSNSTSLIPVGGTILPIKV